jgi:hypothetical protein
MWHRITTISDQTDDRQCQERTALPSLLLCVSGIPVAGPRGVRVRRFSGARRTRAHAASAARLRAPFRWLRPSSQAPRVWGRSDGAALPSRHRRPSARSGSLAVWPLRRRSSPNLPRGSGRSRPDLLRVSGRSRPDLLRAADVPARVGHSSTSSTANFASTASRPGGPVNTEDPHYPEEMNPHRGSNQPDSADPPRYFRPGTSARTRPSRLPPVTTPETAARQSGSQPAERAGDKCENVSQPDHRGGDPAWTSRRAAAIMKAFAAALLR